MNFLFEEDKKDKFIDMICGMHKNDPLKEGIKIFNIEDAVLNDHNIEALFKSNILSNIVYLKLPRNSLGNKGIERLFSAVGNRLGLIKKLDLSSNNIIGEDGARIIANSRCFPNLECLDLRMNKLGCLGFKILVQSNNYTELIDLKIDNNKIEDLGA